MTREQMQAHARRIADDVGVELVLDAPLARYLTMRVGGAAAALLEPRDTEKLSEVVRALRAAGVPHRILGGGSNVLAEDRPIDLVIVHAAATAEAIRITGTRVEAPAALSLGTVLRETTRRGLTGLEWAAGLPGSLGGAVVGNAGAFGGEIGPSVRAVVLLGADGAVRRQPVGADDFAYRRSFVTPDELLLEVELELVAGDPETIRAEVAAVNARRAGSQPKGGHSSGCMFKNPPGDAAGRLIDACGLKGLRRGGARVSEAHANFIINDGTATADDILGLIGEVRETVGRRAGVELELEVRIWRASGEVA